MMLYIYKKIAIIYKLYNWKIYYEMENIFKIIIFTKKNMIIYELCHWKIYYIKDFLFH